MNQNQIDNIPKLSFYRYENFFNVYQDERTQELFYNVLRSINIFQTDNSGVQSTYNISPGDTWQYISYKFYKTLDLWWLVCTYNQIMDPTQLPEAGTSVKLLNPEYVGYVLQELRSQVNR